ncbi:MAG TPA: chemotaxis protein CheW [Pyrinomonadaceae bacterium]|nr:chemotaxis protein CheW [Pyrinomonadaceae bacterium]
MTGLDAATAVPSDVGKNPTDKFECAGRFIEFDLSGRHCLIDAGVVEEVVRTLNVTPLPFSPTWLLGLAAHRGELVAVIDPAVLFPQAKPGPNARSKMLVFRKALGQTYFALPIDLLRKLVTIESGELRLIEPEKTDAITQAYTSGASEAVIVSHQKLIESLVCNPL